jgi:hypothetical protein
VKKMSWVRQVACVGEDRSRYRVLVGKPEERDNLKDLGIDGRMILKCTLKE